MAASADPKQISPKVLGALLSTVGLTVLAIFLSLVTPELFSSLGPAAAPLAAAIAGGGAVLTAYLRVDPLRQDAALTLVAQQEKLAAGLPVHAVNPVTGESVLVHAVDTLAPPKLTPEQQAAQDDRFKGNAG